MRVAFKFLKVPLIDQNLITYIVKFNFSPLKLTSLILSSSKKNDIVLKIDIFYCVLFQVRKRFHILVVYLKQIYITIVVEYCY